MTPSPSPTPPDPSTLVWNWDALSAISTFLAVAVSLFAFWHQRQRERKLAADAHARERSHQAGFVSTWYDDSLRDLWIENRSEQPIYDAGACFLLPRGQPAPDGHIHMPLGVGGGVARVIPPRHRVLIPSSRPTKHPVPVLAFRDAQGITWNRDQHGDLKELKTGVFEHFGVPPDYGYAPVIPQPF